MGGPFADVLTAWTVDPAALLLIVTAGVVYGQAVGRRHRAGRPWPPGRAAAFFAGLAVLVFATCSGVATYDTERFTAHAAQHVLLGLVAPPLLALGGPITLALTTGGAGVRGTLRRLLASRGATVLSHPLVGWALFGGTLVAGYFTPLFEWSLRHDVVHVSLHGVYVAVGCLFFWPLLGVDPDRWRIPHGARLLLVLLAVPVHAFVGVALLGSKAPLAPGWYSVGEQQAAGGLIWVSGALVGVVAAGIVLAQWIRHEERLIAGRTG